MNKKSFNLQRRIVSSFNFVLYGFSVVTSWVQILRIRLRLSPTVSIVGKMLVTVNEKLKLVIAPPLLTGKILTILKSGKPRFSMVSKLRMRSAQTLRILNTILMNIKLRIRVQNTNNLLRIKLVADATVATFRKLLEFDPEILGDLDVLTLGDMDVT